MRNSFGLADSVDRYAVRATWPRAKRSTNAEGFKRPK